MDHCLIDTGDLRYVRWGGEICGYESFGGGRWEASGDGVFSDGGGEAGGEFVDEDIVVDCVANTATYSTNREGEGDAGCDDGVGNDGDGDCGGGDEDAAYADAGYCLGVVSIAEMS